MKNFRAWIPVLAGIAVPLLLCLAWVFWWSLACPEPAGWRAWRDDDELLFFLRQIQDADDHPRLFLFRHLYVQLVHAPGIGFAHLSLVTWGLAVAIVLLFANLVRRHVAPEGPRLLAGLAPILLAAWIFSPGFGTNWLVGGRFGLLLPPLTLLVGVHLLTGTRWLGGRVFLAGLLALAAIFVDRSGLYVWIALTPLVFTAGSDAPHELPRSRRGARLALWCVLGNLASLAAFVSPWAKEGSLPPSDLTPLFRGADRVLDFLGFALRSFSLGVPRLDPGASGEGVLLGVILLWGGAAGAILLFARRREGETLRRALPWFALALFGLGQGLVVIDTWYHTFGGPRPSGAELRELIPGSVFLPVGLLGIAAVLFAKSARPWLRLGVVVALALLVLDWTRGWDHLRVQRGRILQSAGAVVLAETDAEMAAEDEVPWLVHGRILGIVVEREILGPFAPLPEPSLAAIPVAEGGSIGELLSVTAERVRGAVRAAWSETPYSLVLVTARPEGGEETIVRIVAPSLDAGGTLFPWSCGWGEEHAPAPGTVIRAWAFDADGGRRRPLTGSFLIDEEPEDAAPGGE